MYTNKVPTKIGSSTWKCAEWYFSHCLAIGSNDELYSWGYCGSGSLGNPYSFYSIEMMLIQLNPLIPSELEPKFTEETDVDRLNLLSIDAP